MKQHVNLKRRSLLLSLGALRLLPPMQLMSLLGYSSTAQAATGKKYLVTIRTVFDLRDGNKTNFAGDLSPLAPYQQKIGIAVGLESNGGGSEYHNGKQKRFATACTPNNRDNATRGGGNFSGKSFDVVVGEHLKTVHKAKESVLVLGAFPYFDLRTTFESISFLNANQYIGPEYNIGRVMSAVKNNAVDCEAPAAPKYDVEALRRENMIIEATLKDYKKLQGKSEQAVKEQLIAIENKFLELRKNNENLIANGGNAAGQCIKVTDNPVAHNYSRGNTVPSSYESQLLAMNHAAASALASNYTRSVTLNYNFSGHGQNNVQAYHEYTHPGGFARPPSNAEYQALDQLSTFQVNMFAHLLKELEALGILKDTLVVYSPHERPTHNHTDVPVITYGVDSAGIRNFAGRGLFVHDIGADILKACGVAGSENFGGEKAKGGIIS